MICFQCNKCDRTIKVSDAHAGKTGKCPGCGTAITVPNNGQVAVGAVKKTASTAQHVRFTCAMCDKPVKVSARLVGRTIECPNCQCYLDVPDNNAKKEQPKDTEDAGLQLKTEPKPESNPRHLNNLDEYSERNKQLSNAAVNIDNDRIGTNKLPPILEILLYPISLSGLMALAIYVFGPIVIGALSLVLGFAILGSIFTLFLYLTWTSYIFWFFSFCVQQSSQGVGRAPQTIGTDEGLSEMFYQMLRILVCMIIFLLPAFLYRHYVSRNMLYWVIYGVGMAFFPMAILSVTMHSSLIGLNPVLLVVSVIKTLLPHYCIVAISAAVLVLLMLATNLPGEEAPDVVVTLVLNAVYFYLAMVLAHVLGRFYYHSKDKLDWQV